MGANVIRRGYRDHARGDDISRALAQGYQR